MQQQNEFESGREAYFIGDDHEIVGARSEFMEGYKSAWFETEGYRLRQFGNRVVDKAFDTHCAQVEREFQAMLSSPGVSIADAALGTACAFLFAVLVIGSIVFENHEVAEFVRRFV